MRHTRDTDTTAYTNSSDDRKNYAIVSLPRSRQGCPIPRKPDIISLLNWPRRVRLIYGRRAPESLIRTDRWNFSASLPALYSYVPPLSLSPSCGSAYLSSCFFLSASQVRVEDRISLFLGVPLFRSTGRVRLYSVSLGEARFVARSNIIAIKQTRGWHARHRRCRRSERCRRGKNEADARSRGWLLRRLLRRWWRLSVPPVYSRL